MDKRLMAEARSLRRLFISVVVLSVIIGLLIIGQSLLLSRIITRLFIDNSALDEITTVIALVIGIIVLRAVLSMVHSIASAQLAIDIKHDLRERVVEHILSLGPAFTQRERSGELAVILNDGIEAFDGYFREYLPALFLSVLLPVSILIVALPIDLLTFVLLLVTAPLIPIFMILIGIAAGNLAKSQYGALGMLSAHFLDVMQGLPTLKLFNRSKRQVETIQRITEQYRVTTMKVLRLAFLSAFVLELLATISVAVVAVEIGLRLLYGNIGFEQALFLLVIAPEFYQPLRELGAKFHSGRDATASADRMYAVLDTLASVPSGELAPPSTVSIQFNEVVIGYDDDRIAVNDVSFTITEGETVALVGETGSGKSTIANALLKFVAPKQGSITIGDVNLAEMDTMLWRRKLAWVPQSPYLFHASVMENIRIGKPNAARDEVIEAATAAHAHEFITGLDDGYESLIGERGARLSGGQAQRIAIARALLRDAPILILDEATANLDHGTESLVTDAITRLAKGRTVLIIAHRLNTIIHTDRIMVMQQGRLIQQGTHTELMETEGAYRQLVEAYGGGEHVGA